MTIGTAISDVPPSRTSRLLVLMTRERWIEVGRIVLTGVIVLLYWRQLVPVQVLWVAVAIGLYPLVKTGLLDLVREHKIGTEIFVTIATLVAVLGGETVAGAVLMVIILFAEFIAGLVGQQQVIALDLHRGGLGNPVINAHAGDQRHGHVLQLDLLAGLFPAPQERIASVVSGKRSRGVEPENRGIIGCPAPLPDDVGFGGRRLARIRRGRGGRGTRCLRGAGLGAVLATTAGRQRQSECRYKEQG